VQAIVGHIDIEVTGLMAGDWFNFVGETSDWSKTQTVTIGNNASTNTPTTSPSSASTDPSALPLQNPTATPGQPSVESGGLFNLSWEKIGLIVLALAVAVLAAVVVLQHKSKKSPVTAA